MRVLLSTIKKLKLKNGMLILFSLSEDVLDVVKMAGFDKVLHICASEKEALQFNIRPHA
jgi:anti-sigma B factor antagonist/stage II sporulation protein AA (anti-sigma F factor antagonist)